MSLHYEEYIRSAMEITYNLVLKYPLDFLDFSSKISIAYPIAGLPFDATTNKMYTEFIILSNKIRTTFYGLLKRQDFREFLDHYMPSNPINSQSILEGFVKNIESALIPLNEFMDKYGDTPVPKPRTSPLMRWIDSLSMEMSQEFISFIKSQKTYFDAELTKYIKYKDDKIIDRDANITGAYADLIKTINKSVTENHPDLRLPTDSDEYTGHRYISPGFPFVDQDPELEIIEMNKMAEQLKAIIFGQFTALSSGKFMQAYKGLEALFIGEDGTEDQTMKLHTQKALKKMMEANDLGHLMPIGIDKVDLNKFDVSALLNDMKLAGEAMTNIVTSRDDTERSLGTYYWIGENEEEYTSTFIKKSDNTNVWTGDIPPDDAVILTFSQLEQWRKDKTLPVEEKKEKTLRLSKVNLMKLMSRAAMLDYLVTMIYAASFNKQLNTTGEAKSFEESATATYKIFANFDMDLEDYKDLLGQALAFDDNKTLTAVTNESHEVGIQLASALVQKRTMALNMAKLVDEDNPDAFLQYFGVGDLDSSELKWEMLNKFNTYLQTKRKGTMDKAFPTFKIFFIEEDNYVWKAFDDFYSYDAASEISIVESKHAASKTAVMRLSNVTNILTNDVFAALVNEGVNAVAGRNLNLKVGTQVMILIGYGSDYRQLRMKFKGAITEINPGSVLEITAQSWGAGLLNNVGAVGGVSYSSTSGAASMGAAVIDILAQTPGLSQLGRWHMRDEKLNDPNKVAETSFKNAYWARVLTSIAGPLQDFNPIKSNFIDVIKGLPATHAELQTEYRKNNVIVKSFGNSLYDNIIINDTRASGYGFSNWFYRVWNETSNMFTDKAGFQWHVIRQSAWDALHEVAIFLGDYIVTTLPFDEGKDIFLNPPRETLYFGPREGQYKASTFLPRIDVEQQLKSVLTETERPVSNWKDESPESKQYKSTAFLVKFGKTILAETLETMWKYTQPADEFKITHSYESTAGVERAYWDTNESFLPFFVRTLEAHGWINTANIIKNSTHVFVSHTTNMTVSYRLNDLITYEDIPKTTLHEIILNDFEGEYLNPLIKAEKYNYIAEDYIIANALRNGEITNFKGKGFEYSYPAATTGSFGTYDKVSGKPNTYSRIYNPGVGTASPFEQIHKEKENSAFYYIFFGQKTNDPRYFAKRYQKYFQEIDHAIAVDAYTQISQYSEKRKKGLTEKSTGVKLDLESAINTLKGDTQIFQYKPTIGMHAINSYEDILDNSIIATADQMYNHVEVLFDDEPDPTNNISNAKYRAQAWISYDQDPDYLRTYQTYMKNMDSNLFFNTFEANAYIEAADSEAQQAAMLTQHAVAQQVLMNVMKPMYQGTLTMLGNPHIKPWDQVFIHDDNISMYGPVEVEQVVNTISATGGYTTTIIPNLCVTYKSASKQIDDLILSIQSTIQTMGLIGTFLKHAATIGAVWFAMMPNFKSPFKGSIHGKSALGKLIGKGIMTDPEVAMKNLKHAKNLKTAEDIKNVAKKNLNPDHYVMVEEAADHYDEIRLKSKVQLKHLKTNVIQNLDSPDWTTASKRSPQITYQEWERFVSPAGQKETVRKITSWDSQIKTGKDPSGKKLTKRNISELKKKLNNLNKANEKFAKKLIKVNKNGKAIINPKTGQPVAKTVSRASRLQHKTVNQIVRYATTLENRLGITLSANDKKSIDAAVKKIKRSNASKETMKKQLNNIINIQKKVVGKSSKKTLDLAIDKSISQMTIRSSMLSATLRMLNWVGWAWTIYEAGSWIWDSLTVYATSKIFLAGLIAGENQLTWIPLEYQGKSYVAGLEGILGSPRDIDTVLWGEFQGDNNQHNRVISVLQMQLEQFE